MKTKNIQYSGWFYTVTATFIAVVPVAVFACLSAKTDILGVRTLLFFASVFLMHRLLCVGTELDASAIEFYRIFGPKTKHHEEN